MKFGFRTEKRGRVEKRRIVNIMRRHFSGHHLYKYWVTKRVSDLGWVDYDLDVPLILPKYSANSAYLLFSAQAE